MRISDVSSDVGASDLGARGILQSLLVTPVTKPRGSFAVFDGGRRLRALNLRADRGEINPDDFDVPVMVLKGDDATLSETSLAANFHQLKMTPAEECRAFRSAERRVGKGCCRTLRPRWSPYH